MTTDYGHHQVCELLNLSTFTSGVPGASSVAADPGVRVYPNPARGPVTVRFQTARTGRVTLGIYDIGGRLVRFPLDRLLAPWVHTIPWDARDAHGWPVPAGVYYLRIEASGRESGERVTILR